MAFVTTDLIRLYRLVQGADDQVAYDDSGNGADGTLGSTTGVDAADPEWESGGDVLNFTDTTDGTGDFVSIPATGLPSGDTDLTIMVAAKRHENKNGNACAVSYGDQTNLSTPHVHWADTSLKAGTWNGDVELSYAHGDLPTVATFRYDASTDTLEMIADDFEAQTSSNIGTVDFAATNAHIGKLGSGDFFRGPIYAVLIYDRALSDAEVSQNYQQLHTELGNRGVTLRSPASSGETVEANTGSATTTGLSATVATSSHVSVAANAGSAQAAGATASVAVSAHQEVAASAGSVTASGFSPSVKVSSSPGVTVEDFEQYPLGAGVPDGWTEQWETANSSWSIVDLTEGRALQHTATVEERRAVSMDAVGSLTDVEVLGVFRTGAVGDDQNRLYVRGSGAAGSEHGLYAELAPGEVNPLQVGGYNNGTSFNVFNGDIDGFTTGAWVAVRFRVDSDEIKAKGWVPADPNDPTADEPSAWEIEQTQTNVTGAGWVGVGTFQENDTRDFLSVRVENLDLSGLVLAPLGQALADGLALDVVAEAPVLVEASLGAGQAAAFPLEVITEDPQVLTANAGSAAWAGPQASVTATAPHTIEAPLGAASVSAALPVVATVGPTEVTFAGETVTFDSSTVTYDISDVAVSVSAPLGQVAASGVTAGVQVTEKAEVGAPLGQATWTGVSGQPTVTAADTILAPVGEAEWAGVSASVAATAHQEVAAPLGAAEWGAQVATVLAPRVVELLPAHARFEGLQPSAPQDVDVFAPAPLEARLEAQPHVQVYPSVAHQRASHWRRVWARGRSRSANRH